MTKKNLIWVITIVVCLPFFTTTSSAQELRSYFIGNSLTNDMVREGGFEEIVSSISATSILASQHIQCSTPLTGIIESAINEPMTNHTCTRTHSSAGASYDLGTYPSSLNNQIDILVLQPFQNATLQEEIEATKTIIDQLRENPLNADTQIYIYQTWDLRRNSEGYLLDWYGRNDSLNDEFRPSKRTYDIYFNALTEAGYDFDIIPVGQAFADVSEILDVGSKDNLSDTTDLFRDFIHGSNAGRYLAALVTARALTGESTLNVANASEFEGFMNSAHGLMADANASAALRQLADSVELVPLMLGDVDLSGTVDFLDISPFVAILSMQ